MSAKIPVEIRKENLFKGENDNAYQNNPGARLADRGEIQLKFSPKASKKKDSARKRQGTNEVFMASFEIRLVVITQRSHAAPLLWEKHEEDKPP